LTELSYRNPRLRSPERQLRPFSYNPNRTNYRWEQLPLVGR
jgi:hypothetical protein